ncbi:N-acetyltransferase family protein [uncultured Sphaerochaeta sp.]|uniref:GNAT family N-acetyltransferase n=1 Tax=uncultured Sphaerochaeta sp. TaxID=886478 RepID=UPI002A0A941E|nr:N-acetyltransferase family protein [uncultured Sphaerochaeta sp.]
MKMEYSIRKMESSDWSAVSAIYKEGIDTHVATFQQTVPAYEEFDSGHLGLCRLVAVVNQDVVGWVALSPISSRAAYKGVAEVSVYIASKVRSQGIGKSLLTIVADEAFKQGLWTLQSSIISNNKASVVLHEHCGFRVVGYREKIAKDHEGNWLDTTLMEKRKVERESCSEQ